MREIKFRAFHKPTSRMFEVYGLGKDWCTEDTINGVDLGVNCFDGDEFKNDIVIIQFTGKQDLNLTDAYDGDIFKDHNGKIRVISWCVARSCFMAGKYPDEYKFSIPLYEIEIAEIIGNIHENKNQ